MASSLPYVPSNKNVDTLFAKIASAKVPSKFNHNFLQQTIGLKGSNDRAYIPLLRTLGFLDSSGTPTDTYRQLKNTVAAKAAIATGMRTAYAAVFAADEAAQSLSPEKLKGLVAQVAGTDEGMTARIVSTFNSLAKLADFSAAPAAGADDEAQDEEKAEDHDREEKPKGKGLRPEFHYNLQIHLPGNGTEEVYLGIFNALRKVFQ
ncbi:MAG: DUF5343 domain-containing protein [Planctomycetes bacterium]|nr:DUF5343 domain-containing protein [Planctomycetota bacterium]